MTHQANKPTTPHVTGQLNLKGVSCGVIAALGYTSAHTFLRALAENTHPAWVSCVKASCTVLIFGPWLLWANSRSRVAIPLSSIIVLIGAGFLVQIGGNLLYQICLGQIGLALTVPLMMGSMIVSTAFVGNWVLGESISRRVWVSLVILIGSIAILSAGIQSASHSPDESEAVAKQMVSTWSPWVFGVCACVSGFSFSILGVSIGWTTRRSPISLALPMVIVGTCGVISLGGITLFNQGTDLIQQTTPKQWQGMLLAGLSNSTAFLALTYALRVIPIIYVNAINVSQIALAAMIGVWLFQEELSAYLMIGLAMMLLGFATMRKSRVPMKSKT